MTVVSPSLDSFLEQQYEEGGITWIKGFYQSELIDDFVQIWATTDNPDLNHRVHHDAKRAGIMVNVVDDTPYCDFITPSMINRGKIQIAFSSGGGSPVLIRNLRKTFEAVLPQNLSLQAEFAASKRDDIKQKLPNVRNRRLFWEAFFDKSEVIQASSSAELESCYQTLITEQDFEPSYAVTWVETGEDFELLSLKALRLMQSAEMVLHHHGIAPVFIDGVRRDAERASWQTLAELKPLLDAEKQKLSSVVVLLPRLTQALQTELELGFGEITLLKSL
ncbi:siroheme synthase [Vibrio ishigakensis]|uniref:precorrin-2 dehydrogenase n=1 Tax=Vibrio ishigakensis TaxID=1481914 RepID=A0A0B8NYP3_9VIBR|nr:siroheme synthase [Vibrio ishigakensis]